GMAHHRGRGFRRVPTPLCAERLQGGRREADMWPRLDDALAFELAAHCSHHGHREAGYTGEVPPGQRLARTVTLGAEYRPQHVFDTLRPFAKLRPFCYPLE